MPAHIQSLPVAFGPAYIRVAQVIKAISDGVYRVGLEDHGNAEEISARMAMPLPAPLHAGDRVLVAGEGATSGFIIGMLQNDGPQAIRTPDGAGAKVHGNGSAQCISVHDADGHILFEYYPGLQRSVILADKGDLQLAAPNGNIELAAGKSLCCTSTAGVTIASQESINVSVQGREQPTAQNLHLDADGATVGIHRMKVTAGQGDISIARAVYHGKQLTSRIQRAKLVYDKLEVSAKRLWERSEDVIRNAVNLCQMQSGRMRTLVKGAHHMQSERTTIVAKEDVRIDGKKINLG